jgi:hypothetical protein
VISQQYNDEYVLVHCRMPNSAAGKLAGQGADIRVISGKIPIAAEKLGPDSATFLAPVAREPSSDAPSDSSEKQVVAPEKMGDVA